MRLPYCELEAAPVPVGVLAIAMGAEMVR